MQLLEIEVKFFLNKVEPVRDSIIELGGISNGRVFETNLLFEDNNKSLIKKKSLLRLRQDTKNTLTFKSQPSQNDNNFKMLNELEVEVSDFATMTEILKSLGYHKEQIYEKWRETFVLGSAKLCIDTMPYGNFLEIEGEKDEIKNIADRMNLNWENRITINYLELFNIIQKEFNLQFSDLTFSNFENLKIDLERIMLFMIG